MRDDIFPLDFDGLQKGDVVPQAKIESIYRVTHDADPERYRLRMLTLRDEIMRRRTDLVVRGDRLDLRVMTNAETEAHTWDQEMKTVSRMCRIAEHRSRIDTTDFTETDKKVSESRDRFVTAHAILLKRDARKALKEQRLLALPAPKE